jgi:hypothetical protein
MKCAVEMSTGGMIYIPSFIKIGSVVQEVDGGIHKQQRSYHESTCMF